MGGCQQRAPPKSQSETSQTAATPCRVLSQANDSCSIHGGVGLRFSSDSCIYSCGSASRNYVEVPVFAQWNSLEKIHPILWPKSRQLDGCSGRGAVSVFFAGIVRECCRPVESASLVFEKHGFSRALSKRPNSPSLQVFLLFVQPHCCWLWCRQLELPRLWQLWRQTWGMENGLRRIRAGAGADPQWLCLDGTEAGLVARRNSFAVPTRIRPGLPGTTCAACWRTKDGRCGLEQDGLARWKDGCDGVHQPEGLPGDGFGRWWSPRTVACGFGRMED